MSDHDELWFNGLCGEVDYDQLVEKLKNDVLALRHEVEECEDEDEYEDVSDEINLEERLTTLKEN